MALKTVPFNVAFTFSRPDPADYEDINGDTQTAGTDVPRFNYSEGVGEGLILDASLSETAAINDIPNFNSSSGTWVIKADLGKSMPIPGSGFGEFMEGSGTLVFVYSNGVGKCWADGQVLFTVDPFSAAEPEFLSSAGLAKIQDLTYYPYAWTDEDAAAKSGGAFSTYFSPNLFFADGTDGFWGDSTDSATLFQTTAGVTPAAPGDFCGLRLDKSGNGNDQYQATTALKPTVQVVDGVQALVLDNDDDAMLIDVPVGGWSGTFVQGTALGVIVGEIDVPAGPYQIPTDPNYAGPGSDIHTVIVNDSLPEGQVNRLVEWVGQRCPVSDFAGTSSFVKWFRDRGDLTHLDFSRWDVSSVTDMNQMLILMPELRTVDFSGWDVSNVNTLLQFIRTSQKVEVLDVSSWNPESCIDFREFMRDLELVTEIDLRNWTTPSMTDCRSFAQNCTSLTTVHVYGGTGSPFSDSLCTEYGAAFTNTNLSQQSYTDLVTAIEAAGTSNGTLNITGGSSTTTGAAQTAVDALRGRGWTVTTPDGY